MNNFWEIVFGVIFIGFVWAVYFGFIPSGDPPDDGYGGRYSNEINSPFYPLR
jgi:hypothetical protein